MIECSERGGIAFALESAARGGRIVQIGLAGKPVAIPFDLVCYRELTVTSGNASTPRSWRRALELIGDAPRRAEGARHGDRPAGRVGAGLRGDARGLGHQVRARPVHIGHVCSVRFRSAERRHTMANVRRTSMNLDFELVERAKKALGTSGTTETVPSRARGGLAAGRAGAARRAAVRQSATSRSSGEKRGSTRSTRRARGHERVDESIWTGSGSRGGVRAATARRARSPPVLR